MLGCISLLLSDSLAHAQDALPPAETKTIRPFTPIPQFRHLTISNGLPNNTIHAIHQDSQGFMWFGTDDGLSRYDGYQFVTYKQDPDNPDAINGNQVVAIYEDAAGSQWIGTRGGDLNIFNPKTETFADFGVTSDDANVASLRDVTAVATDSQGNIWVGGPPRTGLARFSPQTDTWTQYQTGTDFPPAETADIVADNLGNVWVATNRHLLRWQQDEFHVYAPPEAEGGFSTVLQSLDSQVWIGGASGLYLYDPNADQLTPLPDSPAQITALLESPEGLFWVGTDTGLYQFDPHSQKWQLFAQHHPIFADSLSDSAISTLYQDTAGNIWIGTVNDGLNLFHPRQLQFTNVRHDLLKPDSLGQGMVSGLAGDAEQLWVGTGAVLNQWHNGRFAHYPLPGPKDTITTLATSTQGGAWIGTDTGQLIYFNPTSQEFASYTENLRAAGTPPGAPPGAAPITTPITSIYEDESGIVWVGAFRTGLHQLDPRDGSVKTFFAAESSPVAFSDSPQTIGSHLITTLANGPDGSIWIGYQGGDLSQLNPQTNRFTHYQPEPRIGPVVALYPAPEGLIWAATRRGFARFDPQTETAVLYNEADGLPSGQAVSILADPQGNLWVGTLNGLVKFDPTTETFTHFGVSDGLMAGSFSPNTAWQGANGRFYFGSSDGLTSFHPEQVHLNTYRPNVVFTDLRLFNEPVPVGETTLLPQAIEYTDQLTLAYDNDIISLEFAALTFSAPEGNRYRYRLEGLEENWNEGDSNHRSVTYTDLDAGDYVLHVQGSNESGIWGETETRLRITVLPPWWETVWFRLLVGVSFVGLIAGLFRWRVWQVERRNRELEAEVERQTAVIREAESQKQRLAILEERQRIGRDLHDDLGQVIGYISVQSQTALAQLPPTEDAQQTRTSLTRLIQVAQDAHADVRQYILGIRTGAKRQPTAFIPTLKEYLQTLETLSDFHTTLSLPPQWQDSPCTPEVETQLLRIIQESLTNARKHAGTNEAHLIFTDHDDAIQVIISDKGKGFDLEAVSGNPLSVISKPTTDDRLPTTAHFGLNIMRERAEKVGGRLDIRSALGEGTQIIVRVPKELEIGDPETAVSGLRVLLVDDHQLYLEGIQNLLRTRGVQVIGTANNGLEAQNKAAALQPDLILMDVDMPVCDGLEATRQIKQQWPDIKIVMLTVSAEEEKLLTALRYGASGYLLKSVDGTQFFQMLADAMRGETVLTPQMAAQMLTDMAQAATVAEAEVETAVNNIVLTPRQKEVLELVIQGYTNKEIAEQIGLTERTVKYHVSHILERYQLSSRYELSHLHQPPPEDE